MLDNSSNTKFKFDIQEIECEQLRWERLRPHSSLLWQQSQPEYLGKRYDKSSLLGGIN